MFVHAGGQRKRATPHRQSDPTCRGQRRREVLDGAMTSASQHTADLLVDAAQRLVRTVDGLEDDDWSAPSLLPGWTRAHVVAHLALNAEALARALRGVVADGSDDGPRTMYDSDEQRQDDI